MKKTVLTSILFASVVCAMANDGVFYLAGNQLVPMQEAEISVKKEILTISLGDDGMADVDVYYEFLNKGAEKTILVGFEADAPYNTGDGFSKDGVHPYIHRFSVEMNGTPLRCSNGVYACGIGNGAKALDLNEWKPDTENEDYGSLYNARLDSFSCFSYVYKFDATFRPGSNIIHHTYRYNLSSTVCSVFNLEYKLTPAARWANHKIDDFTLRIIARNTAKHFTITAAPFVSSTFRIAEGAGKFRRIVQYDEQLYEVALRNGILEWHCSNYSPQHELRLVSADELYMTRPYVLGAFYDRSGNYDPRLCHYDDGLKIDTRILRNLPYANRGYVFKSKDLHDYFSKLWWYMPNPSWKPSTAGFTKAELKYIKK